MRRIVCAVDFSEPSREAMKLAARIAREYGAVLALVHVVEMPLWAHEPYVHMPTDVTEYMLATAKRTLDEWKIEAERAGAKEVVVKLADGVAWEQIVAAAASDPPAELVVVATAGRTGLKRALIGSVAERVVRHAPCSVLVVR
jgi:nucleotide-binding universal stress UspA family protein